MSDDERQLQSDIHRRLGLVPTTLPARVCWEGCPNYNEDLDWCRLLHEHEPPGCKERTVLVDVQSEKPNVLDVGRSSKKGTPE